MRYAALFFLFSSASTLAQSADPHPVLSTHTTWVPIMVFLIVIAFLMAAVIGPIVRANMAEELPVAHAHDEPPGSSHHHGKSGTVNPEPEDQIGH